MRFLHVAVWAQFHHLESVHRPKVKISLSNLEKYQKISGTLSAMPISLQRIEMC